MNNNQYIRHYSVPDFGKEGQEKLSQKTVAVIGAGGLGCPVLIQLAGAGVGQVILIEHDIVQSSNLPRQPLYNTADVGRSKAEVADEKLSAMNPDVHITIHNKRLSPENVLHLLADANLVLDCSDNFSTRYLLNDACVILNKPWVFGAIESWSGQYAVFNFPVGEGPTYRCIFPEFPTDAPDCNEAGVLPPLPALIGSYMANAAIQVLAGIENQLSGRLFKADLLTNSFNSVRFARNAESVKAIVSLDKPEYDSAFCNTPFNEIDAESYLSNPSAYQLIDIREEFDYENSPSSGENIPYHELLDKAGTIQNGKPVLLLCDTGKRSHILAKKLNAEDSGTFVSLKGGLESLVTSVDV